MHAELLLFGPCFIALGITVIIFRKSFLEASYERRDRNRELLGLGPVQRVSDKWAIPPGVVFIVIGIVFTIVGLVSVIA